MHDEMHIPVPKHPGMGFQSARAVEITMEMPSLPPLRSAAPPRLIIDAFTHSFSLIIY